MITASRPKIALLAALPLFEADPNLPKPSGHYAVWLAELFRLLEQQNEVDIHWIVLDKGTKHKRLIEARNQHIHVLPRGSKTLGLCTCYIRERMSVAAELRQLRPQLVHAWGTEDCYALCGKDFKGQKLLSIQGLLKACMQRGKLSRFHRLHSLFETPSIRAYQHLTTESPWAAERVNEQVPGRIIHPLEYAVEDIFWNVPRCPAPSPCALFAGSDTPIKNIDSLLLAFQDPRLASVTLKLAGVEPSKHPNLPPNIQPLGRVSRKAMAQLLSETWCLVHPSLADTGPTIVKEARVMGIPTVVSSACGSKQHVTEGKSGFIFSPLDTEALIQAVLKVTASREHSLSMGSFQQEECRRVLSPENMCRTLIHLYNELLLSPCHSQPTPN